MKKNLFVPALAALLAAPTSQASITPPPFASFTAIGDVSNYTNPGVWEYHQIDISALVGGAAKAVLSFDFANDLAGTGSTSTNLPTNAHLYFAADSAAYYLNFEYFMVPATATEAKGNASAHMRDVRLTVDGVSFIDQFGAINAHLGDALFGSAYDGDGDGQNILGQTGFDARTYVLTSAVPLPPSFVLMLAGMGLMGGLGKKGKLAFNRLFRLS